MGAGTPGEGEGSAPLPMGGNHQDQQPKAFPASAASRAFGCLRC